MMFTIDHRSKNRRYTILLRQEHTLRVLQAYIVQASYVRHRLIQGTKVLALNLTKIL